MQKLLSLPEVVLLTMRHPEPRRLLDAAQGAKDRLRCSSAFKRHWTFHKLWLEAKLSRNSSFIRLGVIIYNLWQSRRSWQSEITVQLAG
jgi:hypothetical protein